MIPARLKKTFLYATFWEFGGIWGIESQKSLKIALGTYVPCQESSTFAKISPCGAVNTMFSFQKTVMVMHFVWHHTKIHGFPLKTKGILGSNSRKKLRI